MDEIIKKLEAMANIMGEVTEKWNHLSSEDQDKLADEYPFQKSFDEVVLDVENWIESVR